MENLTTLLFIGKNHDGEIIAIEAIQVKHSTHDGEKYKLKDFIEDPANKGKKVQLSKYFDSWLILKHRYPSIELNCILYSNYDIELGDCSRYFNLGTEKI